ncbi:MAG: protein-export chaperone SecB [Verrucomicrobiales bacterium]|nr:protein-export chaperone SecB [Verrucomicrobiales bacterium]
MLSAIQVRRHFVRSFHFDASPNHSDDYEEPELEIAFANWKNDDHWIVRLKVETTKLPKSKGNPPYLIRAEVEGLFDVHPDFPKERVEEIVKMNGGAILYAAIRELVITHSSRSLYGPAELPTIDARMFLEAPSYEEASPAAMEKVAKTNRKQAATTKKGKKAGSGKSAEVSK